MAPRKTSSGKAASPRTKTARPTSPKTPTKRAKAGTRSKPRAAAPRSTTKRSGVATPKGASKAAGSGSPNGRQAARWTEDQVRVLMEAVKASPTAKAGFERAARELGKSVGTVAQKYYLLQRTAGTTRTRVTKRAAGARSAGAARAGKARDAVAGTTPTELAVLTTEELARLAGMLRKEIDRRQGELMQLARSLGQRS